MDVFSGLITAIWRTFEGAAPFILSGLFLSGLIQIFVDKERIARYLGRRDFKSVLLAAAVGVPMPLCSCGVIPMAMSLRKNGASKGAILSFLISTPETGLDSLAISYALLDPLMTVFRPLAAFATAMIAGASENVFGVKEAAAKAAGADACESCCPPSTAKPAVRSAGRQVAYGLKFAFVDLLGDLAKWFILGIVIAGVIGYFVPEAWITHYLGQGLPAMLIMLAAGVPLYICASASTPIAAALILKGMSPGVALVFLLAGPATNAATILMVGKFLGKRSAAIYLASIAVCAIVFGSLLNGLYAASGTNAHASLGHACELLPPGLQTASAVLLLVLIANTFRR